MIDIHSHILWGIDDGARTLDESLEMLELAAGAGTTDIVATPHASSRYGFHPETIRARVEELRSRHSGPPRIHTGCDFHLSPLNIEDALHNPTKYTINSGRYLLVELPEMFSSDSISRALRLLYEHGIVPIITHPERNPSLQRSPESLDTWVNMGYLIQITAASFSGRFGRVARRLAFFLLRTGRAHFVASDAHDATDRTPQLDGIRDLLTKELGDSLTQRLLVDYPRAVIEDCEDFIEFSPRPMVNKWQNLWGWS